MDRLRLSERRLLGVLDALVARRFARPLHRDNRGTLWRVYLPREAFGERLGDDVLVGRASGLRLLKTATSTAPTIAPPPRPSPTASTSGFTPATTAATTAATTTATTTTTPTPTAATPR